MRCDSVTAWTGPRSRALLQSGVEGLAPGEELPEQAAAARAGQDGLAAAARAAPKQDVVSADIDSDDESAAATPRQPEVRARSQVYTLPGGPPILIINSVLCS